MVFKMNDTDNLLDLVRDEYIAVLLEFYSTRSEMERPSPSEFHKVNFWKIRVNDYEKELFPENIKGRVIYRVKKAEKKNMGPIQLAMARYAWNACLSESESSSDVKKRWQEYFVDKGDGQERRTLVGHDEFSRRRNFFEMVSGLKKAELWPWKE